MSRVYNQEIITAGDMSQATVASQVIRLDEVHLLSFQWIATWLISVMSDIFTLKLFIQRRQVLAL